MNSKNKIVILTMAVAFTVTGCGNKQSADTSPAVSSSSETNETTIASDTTNDSSESEESNILITYFSVMETDGVDTVASASRVAVDGKTVGNNEYLASLIHQEIIASNCQLNIAESNLFIRLYLSQRVRYNKK